MTTQFQERVYDLLREVPRGKVTTYADLAHALGMNCPRAIGQAMRRNPYAPEVPCHRVVRSDGTIGGFMGETDGVAISRKESMLAAEGVEVVRGKVVAFQRRHHTYTTPHIASQRGRARAQRNAKEQPITKRRTTTSRTTKSRKTA